MMKVGIIGGGASGIICAITIKHHFANANVVILERQNRIGKKLLMTGSGKCNLSNLDLSLDNYNTKIIFDTLKAFDTQKCIEFFEKIGLLVRVDDAGRVYPYSEKATTVLEVFLQELKRLKIEVRCDFNVIEIKKADQFIVYSDKYDFYNFDYVVLATGGKAAINFENNSYELAQRLGHQITPLQPGLVALKVYENTAPLAGLRMKARVFLEQKISSCGEVQFKKDGLSGIAIFDISRYCKQNTKVFLDLMPDKTKDEIIDFLKQKELENGLMGIFPKMIVWDLLRRGDNLDDIVNVIKNYQFTVKDTYGFHSAQITVGGIFNKEVSPLDFSSLVVERLYIIGEILDIDGKCGGYNLHFAWASGYLAGRKIAEQIGKED